MTQNFVVIKWEYNDELRNYCMCRKLVKKQLEDEAGEVVSHSFEIERLLKGGSRLSHSNVLTLKVKLFTVA